MGPAAARRLSCWTTRAAKLWECREAECRVCRFSSMSKGAHGREHEPEHLQLEAGGSLHHRAGRVPGRGSTHVGECWVSCPSCCLLHATTRGGTPVGSFQGAYKSTLPAKRLRTSQVRGGTGLWRISSDLGSPGTPRVCSKLSLCRESAKMAGQSPTCSGGNQTPSPLKV